MTRYCDECNKEYDCTIKKCPVCGKKMEKKYTKEELDEIQKINDDYTVISMIM